MNLVIVVVKWKCVKLLIFLYLQGLLAVRLCGCFVRAWGKVSELCQISPKAAVFVHRFSSYFTQAAKLIQHLSRLVRYTTALPLVI